MITKPAFSKTIYATLFATAMLLGSSAAFAQVKIGTNPTSINAANNLEVEASTTGRKTSIDKTSGQVTIKDGTEGTGKVLTSDANGGASWQNKDVACSSFETVRSAPQVIPINDPSNFNYTTLISDVEYYDPSGAYNPTTGEYTVPATGFYSFKGSCGDFIAGVSAATRNTTIAIFSALKGNLSFSVVQDQTYASGSWNSVSTMNYLTAGDIITFKAIVVHVNGTKPATTIPVSSIQFSGSRIDCNKN